MARLSYKSLFIILFFLLIAIVGLLKLTQKTNPAAAGWFNESWMYRVSVNIGNTSGSNLTDFQIAISIGTSALINSGKMQSDCDDIRITDQNGNLLSYWFSGCNTTSTKIWPKIPNIPNGGATVYVYYGNSTASSYKTTIGTSDYPGLSCKSILDAGNSTGNGNYWIDPTNGNTSDKFQAYCDMTNNSGGWLLVTASMINSTNEYNVTKIITTDTNGGTAYTFTHTTSGCGGGPDSGATIKITNNIQWDRVRAKESVNNGTSACWGFNGNNSYGSQSAQHNLQTYLDGTDTLQNCVLSCTAPYVMPPLNRCDENAANFGRFNFGSERSFEIISRRTNRTTLSGPSAGLSCNANNMISKIENIYIKEDSLTFAATPGTPATEELSPAPIAYWKFDEGVGNTAYNSISNTKHGILSVGNSAPTWQTEDQCISGKCLRFDGTDDGVRVTNSKLNLTGAVTVSAWIKNQETRSGRVPISRGNYTEDGWYWWVDSGSWRITYNAPGLQNTADSGRTIPTNQWSHLVSVIDNANQKIYFYLNGKYITQVNMTFALTGNTTRALSLGNFIYTGYEWKGMIDEVKIYPYARTATQIKQDYASGKAHSSSTKGTSANLGGNKNSGEFLSDGLIGYWKMDENTGTSTTDSSGNNNNGTFGTGNSAPTWSSGKFGVGLSFDGTNDYVDAGNILNMGTNDMTISTWIKTSAAANQTIISKSLAAGQNYRYSVGTGSGSAKMFMQGDGGADVNFAGTKIINDGVWHNITYIFDRDNKASIYVDGVYDIGQTISQWNGKNMVSINPFRIGAYTAADNTGITSSFNGIIDEVRIYNRALSPNEVSQLYNWAAGPSAHWKMDEASWNGTSGEVIDSSGNGNNGVRTGDATTFIGKYGKSGKFDGNGDWISLTSEPFTASNANYTIGLWAKYNNLNNTSRFISWGNWGTSGNRFFFGYNSSSQKIEVGHGNITIPPSSATYKPTINTWEYWTITNEGTTTKFYKNGILISSETHADTGTISTGYPIRIGRQYDTATEYFDGLIDDFKIYNYARSAKQIVEDMNAGHPAGGSPVGSQVGYWKFDEGFGTTTSNWGFGGTGLNGTFGAGNSAPTWTNNGKFNKALNFDGNDYINANNNAVLNSVGSNPITITAWIKSTSISASDQTIFSVDEETDGTRIFYAIKIDDSGSANANKPIVNFYNTGSYDVASGNTTIAGDNQWHHIVGLRDGTLVKIYVDGKLSGTTTDNRRNVTNTDSYAYVGASKNGNGINVPFNGLIDEVKIYNYALTEDEIKIDYNRNSSLQMGSLSSGTGNTAPPTASSQEYCVPGDTITCSPPVARWDFNEKVGTTAYDISGNNFHTIFAVGNSTPSWAQGKIGTGVSFNGTGGKYMTAGDINSLDVQTGDFTVESWVNIGSTNAAMIAGKDNCGDANMYLLGIGTSSGTTNLPYIRTVNSTGTNYINYSSGQILLNTWYHIVGVKSGSTTKIYVNSILKNSLDVSGTFNDNAYSFRIGDREGTDPSCRIPTNAKIDNLRVFNYARSPAQIAWDYNKGGPVGHWKFDECQGNKIEDWSGIGNTGSVIIGASGNQNTLGTCSVGTSAAWTNGATGKFNSSLKFDGTDDYALVSDPANGSLDFGIGSFSYGCWVYITSSAGQWDMPIYKGGSSAGNTGYDFELGTGNWSANLADTDTTTTNVSFGTETLNQWVHLMAVVDRENNSFKAYKNGIQVNSTSLANLNSTSSGNSLYLGHNTYFFKGLLDDVRIYNYALTSTQIKTLYNNGAVTFSEN